MTRRNRGFALIVTLWMIVGACALSMVAADTARDALGSARNRGNYTHAHWAAFGCLERMREAMYGALWPDDATPQRTLRAWTNLDGFIVPSVRAAGCDVSMTPAGTTVNLNAISEPQLRRLLASLNVPLVTADSLVDAFLDWRDADDVTRVYGAESDWYRARGLTLPRNGNLAAAAELSFVRGFDKLPALQALVSTDSERVLWTRAPRAVLATLPGLTDEALDVLSRRFENVEEIAALGDFPEMSAAARDTLARNAPGLITGSTSIPGAWLVRASAARGSPAISAGFELKVGLASNKLLVLRRLTTP